MSYFLDPILNPKSVAVVGASKDPKKRGYQAMRALLESGYQGAIHPVNPNGGELFGRPVARTVLEIDDVPDLALICTPAETVPGVIERCGRKGIRGAVVLAAGFREASEEGDRLEAEVLEVARRGGVRVVGPNTSGILNTSIGLNLVGARGVRPGRLGLLAQSGNIALALMNEAVAKTGQGLSIYVGVGNEADIQFHEYLEYLETEPQTAAILMYVEGMRDARSFFETARRVSARKPIVLLKGGRSERGGAAVRSHTGAVAGSYATLRAALRQAGVVEVHRSDELFQVGRTLAEQPPLLPDGGVAILSDGGGHGALAADMLETFGVPLADLSQATRERLREILGFAAGIRNPVDLAGAGDENPLVFAHALEILEDDPAVGGVILVGLFGGYAIRFDPTLAEVEVRAAQEMTTLMASQQKTLVVHSLYAAPRGPWAPGEAPTRLAALERLIRSGVPVVESLELACRCLAAARQRGLFLSREQPEPAPAAPAPPPGRRDGFEVARREGRTLLLEPEARELVSAFGVALAPGVFCSTAGEAGAAVERLGGPAALKVVSSSIAHKTDAGGVILNVVDSAAGAVAFDRIAKSAAEYAEARQVEPEVRGVLVTKMLPAPAAELLVGVRRDPDFGPVLTVGAGGVAVEVLRDVVLRVLPVTRGDVLEMLDELRTAALLRGHRGRPPANREAVADLALGLARCALAHPEIAELEANPVFAYPDGALAVDVRAFLSDSDRSD